MGLGRLAGISIVLLLILAASTASSSPSLLEDRVSDVLIRVDDDPAAGVVLSLTVADLHEGLGGGATLLLDD